MGKFTRVETREVYANCLMQAYAYYGVELFGIDAVQTGPLEEVILVVMEMMRISDHEENNYHTRN